MPDSLPLPARFVHHPRPATVPPKTVLTKEISSARSLPLPTSRRAPSSDLPWRRPDFDFGPAPIRRTSSSVLSSNRPLDNRRSSSPLPKRQLAHQLAAETLLSIAPPADKMKPSASPDNRNDKPALVPAPAQRATPLPAEPEKTEEDHRGIKRKNGDEDGKDSRLPSAASLGLVSLAGEREREKSGDRAVTKSPMAHTAEPRHTPASTPAQPLSHLASRLSGQNASQTASPSVAATQATTQASPANPPQRYSIYGPTARDGLTVSPWGAVSQSRYTNLGLRRDMSPSVTTTPASAAPKPAQISPPRRASPDLLHRDSRYFPQGLGATGNTASSLSGYGHYSMGRRELAEHREQLREGKRWLEGMLGRTEKMLHMVENKMALTGEMGAASASSSASQSTSLPLQARRDEWEFEERERARAKEIQRLEEEREKDKAERERKEREREREREALNPSTSFFDREAFVRGRQAARERTEAERNRDLLLASRRVTAVSPNPLLGRNPPPASNSNTANANAANASAGGSSTAQTKASAWDGEPVMAPVALPRREQQAGRGLGLGRGLWSFDVRG
ncbi:hypothetical protein P7C73_g1243, partial [Tremellales sp. Uapishka_1]